MHAFGQLGVLAGADATRSQELHDPHKHTLHDGVRDAFLRQRRVDPVRVLNTDGAEHRFLGRPVFRLHRRGVRTEAQRRPDVRHQRVLLRRLVAVHRGLRHHPPVAADHTHQHDDPGHNYCHFDHGKTAVKIITAVVPCSGMLFRIWIRGKREREDQDLR